MADQLGTPTYAGSPAESTWRAALAAPPLLHFRDAGAASWYDFVVSVCQEARGLELISADPGIMPIGSEQHCSRVNRTSYSVLDTRETSAALSGAPLHWRVTLRRMLREMRT